MVTYFFASRTQWIISSGKKKSQREKKQPTVKFTNTFLGLGTNAIQADTKDA